MVKKIAAGYNRSSLFSNYLVHVLISGGVFYFLLLLCYLLFPNLLTQQPFLLFIGIGKLGIFFSTPFKQLAAGLEKFSVLFMMSIVSNILRGTALLILLILHMMSVQNVLITFIAGDLLELALCIVLAKTLLKTPFRIRWNKRKQLLMLKESLPQTGVVLFTAVMSRFDWILIGVFVSSSRLAEYSFAYKIFEVSTLPLLIIAPIMIPLFTRLHRRAENIASLLFFLEWQIIIASFIALLLNFCWIPVIDFISDGKYGSVNSETILLLSFSMPLLYFVNFLWTINFAGGNLKLVFKIMAVSFAVNIISCSILIPLYKNEGAAIAYVITALVQLILYLQKKTLNIPLKQVYLLVFWPLAAIFCGFIAFRYTTHPALRISIATFLYLAVAFMSKRVQIKDWKTLQSLYQ